MKRRILAALLVPFACTAFSATARKAATPLKPGDILFQYIPCGPLCEAIVATTPCAKDHPFNHCGIVVREQDSLLVLEAVGRDVHTTPLADFLRRDTGAVVYIGRLRDTARGELGANLKRALALRGRPYDNIYLPGDSALYCTELVYESYYRAGRKLFRPEPMSFKAADGQTFPGWADYYRELGRDIPEGLPGTNPCGLSRDPALILFSRSKAELLRR